MSVLADIIIRDRKGGFRKEDIYDIIPNYSGLTLHCVNAESDLPKTGFPGDAIYIKDKDSVVVYLDNICGWEQIS